MSSVARVAQGLVDEWRQRGPYAAFLHLGHETLHRLLNYERLDVTLLERDALRPVHGRPGVSHSTRRATREDLESMMSEGSWVVSPEKLQWLDSGFVCLLSEVDGRVAGYTWAHDRRRADLLPGLSITVPEDLLYNFDAFTHPDFRGYGLQGLRHHALLGLPEWASKRGLVAFVTRQNFASRHGQHKSGYRRIGEIRNIRAGGRLYAHLSKSLRKLGIRRVPSASSPIQTSGVT